MMERTKSKLEPPRSLKSSSTGNSTSRAKHRPHTSFISHEISICNQHEANDSKRGVSAPTQFLKYQPGSITCKKNKALVGPFNVNDIPDIRNVLKTYRSSNSNRKVYVTDMTNQLYNDLELNDYFAKKSNWTNKSKYISTNSFFSAVQVYFPSKNNRITLISSKLKENQPKPKNKIKVEGTVLPVI